MKKKIKWGCQFLCLFFCFLMIRNVSASEVGEEETGGSFTAFYHEYARKAKPCSSSFVRERIPSIGREEITSESELYVERGTRVLLEYEGDFLEEENISVEIHGIDFASGRETDLSADYLKDKRWQSGQEGLWYLYITFPEEGHFRVTASCCDTVYEGPVVTVDESCPVLSQVTSSQKPQNQLEGYDFFAGYPVYEIVVEEENFHSDCFTWRGNHRGIRMSDWNAAYEEGVRKNRVCFVPEEEGRYDLYWEVKDAGGRNRVQGECHFVVDSSAPQLSFSVEPSSDIYRYPYDDMTYCSKRSIPVCLTAEDAESGIAGIRYLYWNKEGKVREGYQENPHFSNTFSILVDELADQSDFCGWMTAVAVNRMGLESSEDALSQTFLWESQETHHKNASVEILYPDDCQIDSEKKIRYYREKPEIRITGIDAQSGICKSYIQAVFGKEVQREEVDYRLKETVQKEIAQKIQLSLSKMDQSSDQHKISILAGIEDHAGYEKKVEGEYSVVVDSKAPRVQVTYDENRELPYYNRGRTAVIRVKDWNFDSSQVKWKISGRKDGYSIGAWQKKGEESWCKITFLKDGSYQIGLKVSDYAGNQTSWEEERFTIDQKKPAIHLWMDQRDRKNEKYYASEKMVYLLLKEENIGEDGIFIYNGRKDDSDRLKEIRNLFPLPAELRRMAEKGGWKVYAIKYNKDAAYHIHAGCQDLAGNQAETSGGYHFIIDRTKPKLSLENLRKNIIYTEADFQPQIHVSDGNLDKKQCRVQVCYSDGTRVSFLEERMNRVETGDEIVFSWDDFPEKKENDNRYFFKVIARDLAGNEVVKDATIPFFVDRYGTRYLLEEGTENYLKTYYHREEEDICIRAYSLFPLKTECMVLKDKEKIIPLTNQDCQVTCRLLTSGEDVEEKIRRILPLKVQGWYESRYRISKNIFSEEGDYQITFHSKEKGGGGEEIAVTDSENTLWTESIEYAIDKTPPDVILGGLEEEVYESNHHSYTLTAMDNHRLKRIRLHVKKDGKDSVTEYTEETLNEYHSITEELTASKGYQYVGYEAWDYAGNYSSNLRTSEEKRVLVSENRLILSVFRHPFLLTGIFLLFFLVVPGLIVLTRRKFFGIFKRQEKKQR